MPALFCSPTVSSIAGDQSLNPVTFTFKPAIPAPPWPFLAEIWIPSVCTANSFGALSHEPNPKMKGLLHRLMTGLGLVAGSAAIAFAARSIKPSEVKLLISFVGSRLIESFTDFPS